LEIAIGLPATIPGTPGADVLEWARRTDDGPFSSLGVIDRLVYDSYEPLVTLAAAAAVTKRIRLMPAVLLAPLRPAALLAKEAASVDALSGGRLTLGLGVGGRDDDFTAVGAGYHDRGRRFDEQLAALKRIWTGEPLSAEVGPIGPRPVQPGGPPLLIGGQAPAALRRVGRWGDGYLAVGDPASVAQAYERVLAGWREASRSGRPRFVVGGYYVLGHDAVERGLATVRHYYAFLGAYAEMVAGSIPTTPAAIKNALQAYRDIGVDEVGFTPTVADFDQIDRLADVIG
jgi:alkanesulfonate monooxygenase SsuD/methylene tetrahydromethanopterin reductase-like flavin-dependent oxidoreductase (luciferase family)